jgi:hypothetical protein
MMSTSGSWVAGCWTISRRGESCALISLGAGEYTMDYAKPPPVREPVTTIAWRLAHLIDVFGPPTAPISRPYPPIVQTSTTRVAPMQPCASRR